MRAWILTAVSALLGGCFSPDYGPGGFACNKTSECPGGYSCVVESTGKVCRKGGAPLDLARPDQARDGSKIDGRASPDGQRDGRRPDGLKVDGALPPCAKPSVVTTDTHNGPQAFDQVLDGSGSPHILFVDAKTNVSHAVYKGSWSVTALPFSASQVAVALSSDTLSGTLQAAFRALDAGFTPRLWHTYRDLPIGAWAKPVMVSTTLAAVNADIAAYKDLLYIAATGKTSSSILEMYRAVKDTSGYSYTLYASQTNDYSHARVGVGPAHAGITAFIQAGTTTAWALRRDPHAAGPGTQQSVPGNQSGPAGPAAVAMDSGNQLHLALVRGKGTSGPLYHVTWSGIATDKPVESLVAASCVVSSVDIALDQTGTPVISYYDDVAGEVRLARRESPVKWIPITVSPAKVSVNTRIAVYKNVANVAYDRLATGGSWIDLYHTTCTLP